MRNRGRRSSPLSQAALRCIHSVSGGLMRHKKGSVVDDIQAYEALLGELMRNMDVLQREIEQDCQLFETVMPLSAKNARAERNMWQNKTKHIEAGEQSRTATKQELTAVQAMVDARKALVDARRKSELLHAPCNGIQAIRLISCTAITDEVITGLAEQCIGIQAIVLSGLAITDASVEALARHCAGLQTIYLSHCTLITNAAVEALIQHCAGIRTIGLVGCTELSEEYRKEMGPEDIEAVLRGLATERTAAGAGGGASEGGEAADGAGVRA